ncbi:AAA domain-containing protein [Akkermansiaceae bacterium]|nr:AAA domain-containing protein [Akkermansiaceae bacterium]MDB4276738.1 AAA domain-containing protein [bacterium]MDA7650941.1 AAA domain-containing protein [Akkermansiaceae bacterium]MDB4041445.1 AAA domain-containing protein [Akkermansiaceae bacterium]MDB4305083.1 AAA domain-containing protein [Akkermansiaceae bacterium]
MKLKTFNPEGVHSREIKGLAALTKSLPDHWFGYASFEMIGHDSGEIDLIICAEDRLIAVEIKDWNGTIEDHGRTWITSGRQEKSPVITIREKAKKLASKLRKFLAPKYDAPWIDYCVLLTGASKRAPLNEDSKEKTFELEFFQRIGTKGTFKKCFPGPGYLNAPRDELKVQLDKFFSGDRVRPQSLSYSGYKAKDDPCYTHPKRIYSEYITQKAGARGYQALLRRWDFEKLAEHDSNFLNAENRKVLALREQNAIGYLRDMKPDFYGRNVFLSPIGNEDQETVTDRFYELYELPTTLHRLKESLQRFGGGLKDDNRVSLCRLLLSHFSELHELEVTHRDIGEHCIWVTIPDKVTLSGFATSSFPEQTTVSQIRETIRAGKERIPEDVLETRSDNYRKDVFLLGSVVHQILFGKRPPSPDGFPSWEAPDSSKFQRFWGWFERCLEMDPENRFPDAKAAFEEFQRCDALEKRPSVTADDFEEFSKNRLPLPGDGDETLREDDHGLVFKTTDQDYGICLVKVWANARFNPADPDESSHLLEFFKRIQKLQTKDLQSQQKILEFGHTRYGSYVSLRWDAGSTLDKCEFADYDDEKAIVFVTALVRAVSEMHETGIYHGDLKPENLLLAEDSGEGVTIRLIDCIDYSPTGTQRRSSSYLPPEGEAASTPACDGYAVWKIVSDFIFPQMEAVSESLKEQVSEVIEEVLDPDGGNPDFVEALQGLETISSDDGKDEDASDQEIIIAMGRIDSDFVMLPDDRGIPVEAFPDRDNGSCVTLRITAMGHKLLLRYDSRLEKLTKVRRLDSSLVDYTGAMKRPLVLLKAPIRVLSQDGDSLLPLEVHMEEEGVFAKAKERVLSAGKSEDDGTPPKEDQQTGSSTSEPSDEPSEAEADDVVLEELWEALIEAESRMLPEVTITAEPVLVEASATISIPIGEASKPFDFQDDEPVQVELLDREGQWRYYATLDNRRTRSGVLAVKASRKGRFMPNEGALLRLENKRSRGSYDKRQGATQRILDGRSVCPDLIRYFACDESVTGRRGRFSSRLEGLNRYVLNDEQREALRTALSASPLSMIQGPPGTGKTSVISAAVHHLATNYRSAKILVVSQSHEAIDHATEQIVKRFRKQGEEPSLVRVGRRAAISDNLISFHSESLQGEYRERFRLSMTDRIAPVGKRLGLGEEFVGSVTVLRSRLAPKLRQLNSAQSGEDSEVDSVAIRNLRSACRQLDPDFEIEGVDFDSIYGAMEERLASRLGETDVSAINALRKVVDLALEWIDILEAPGKLDNFYVRSCQVVTGTCVGVGSWGLGLEGEVFDCVIIDEAARCGPGDLAVASQVAEQVILLGDHKQLPPFLDKELVDIVANDLGCQVETVKQSDFQRLFRSDYAAKAGRTLKTQYRMREPIGDLVSACFYPEVGGLKSGRSESAEVYSSMPSSLERHVMWIDSGAGREERVGTSFVNRHEIDRIIEILEELAANDETVEELVRDAESEALPAAIGIIAAYKAQADAIEERIWTSSLPERVRATCKVGTVDSYQGKENPIVIFSAVRCNHYAEIGFTRSWERVNVSLSRARERLVIVGSWDFWRQAGEDVPLGKVANYFESKLEKEDGGFGFQQCESVEK